MHPTVERGSTGREPGWRDDETTTRLRPKSKSLEKSGKVGFSIGIHSFKKPISSGTEGTLSERIRMV